MAGQSMTGVVRGNAIQLDQPIGLPEGQPVRISVEKSPTVEERRQAIASAFGSWADDNSTLEEIAEFVRQGRAGRY